MSWIDKLKPFKGDVYRPGQCLPEPDAETATGRKLYTVQQIRSAYKQGGKHACALLIRCRNVLSHGELADPVIKAQLYADLIAHLEGLEQCESWTCREKRLFRESLRKAP